MRIFRKLIGFVLGLFYISISAFGQEVEMADGLRAEGKIYVVVAVVLVILIGLFFYLIRLDGRIKKLEKK